MARSGTYYLDTSALVKRYVMEPGTEVVDEIFSNAHAGRLRIALSHWNIAEAGVVFDKYERRLATLSARELFRKMLDELMFLARLQAAVLAPISPGTLEGAIEVLFRHHIYVADAIQIVTAKEVGSDLFVTADAGLAKAAESEGLKALLVM